MRGFPCGSAGKQSASNVGDLGSIPGLGWSPREGKGYPLQYSGLENSKDCIVHGITKSQKQLSNFYFTDEEFTQRNHYSSWWEDIQNFSVPSYDRLYETTSYSPVLSLTVLKWSGLPNQQFFAFKKTWFASKLYTFESIPSPHLTLPLLHTYL